MAGAAGEIEGEISAVGIARGEEPEESRAVVGEVGDGGCGEMDVAGVGGGGCGSVACGCLGALVCCFFLSKILKNGGRKDVLFCTKLKRRGSFWKPC